MRKRAFMR